MPKKGEECDLGYDHQEYCQRYHIIGCLSGYFEELKDESNPLGYANDCRHLIRGHEK
jgi:hypothetical protein